MNHLANPLVGSILTSPFHRFLSGSLVLLSYRGQKSGKRFQLPVDYAQSRETLWILPGAAEKKTWWRNLRGGCQVELVLRGQRRRGQATLLSTRDDPIALAQGLGIYFGCFPASARLHEIRVDPEGNIDPGELSRVAQSLVMVRIQMTE